MAKRLKEGSILRIRDTQIFNYNKGGEICERLTATGYRGKPLRYVMLERNYYDERTRVHEEGHGVICEYLKRDRQIACRGCPLISGKVIRVSDVTRDVKKVQI